MWDGKTHSNNLSITLGKQYNEQNLDSDSARACRQDLIVSECSLLPFCEKIDVSFIPTSLEDISEKTMLMLWSQ